jgi:hypothetical protein
MRVSKEHRPGSETALTEPPSSNPLPGLAAVDALARLALLARRLGCPLTVRVSPELRELVAFCGLSDPLGVERRRKTEEREETLDVEERVEPGDAPA